ncbi:TIGR01777 family oxidoreductase [Neobacillus ginsengisoli]|uniref:Uncharacterized protein (TIGR01777 family) n=1 Tax=Neobacillus ginsengisoli TaxID=904295 RepID=A0ABT9Y0N3_9BACI|nr:TIGR01777 family oxidoreductase [Neobacillus ginsengisoli]MDQ0200684.1 uncharacterized protein (TIGR01777 family) [Neobacillus ginsengisoli]
MKIAITGGTGFVGKALVSELVKHDHEIVILTRKSMQATQNNRIRYVKWLIEGSNPIDYLQDTDIIINLAGESISSGRWNKQRQDLIVNSRKNAVREILDIANKLTNKPKALINASAIGFYGTSETNVFTEEDKGLGNDFLSDTVKQWESEANKAAELGMRTVLCRFGIILDKNEGALPKITLPYKAFIGGNLGNGRQWMSWIHIEDVVKGILFILENEKMKGPVNFTAPHPVTMNEFGKTLANVLHRPHWLPAPSFALRLLLGEMSMLVLEGQKAIPKKLIENGFHFNYTELSSALKNIFPQK